ncbi:MAG: helix-turn-helix domain-containing protein [Burkholderiaceae bacterium]
MSDTQAAGLERPARPTVADGPVAAGAMLRQAREAAGVHLGSLATSLKVPAGRLEALETGRIDLLPDPTFARALAASVCRSLRIDAEPVLQLLPRTSGTPSAAELAATKTPFRSDSPASGRARSGGLSRPIGIIVVLLLLATAALIFAPDFGWQLPGMATRDNAGANQSTGVAPKGGSNNAALTAEPSVTGNALRRPAPEPAAVRPPAAAVAPAASAATAASPPPAGSSVNPSAQAPGANASAAVAQAQRQAASAVAAAPPAAAATNTAAQKANDDVTMLIETVVPTWVQVLDSSGAALVKRTVPAGEKLRLKSDALPLKVVLGHSDKTKVQVRGEPYDLDPVSRGGVARFQVK